MEFKLLSSFLILLSLAIYWNSLNCDFVFDDISAVRDNKDLRGTTPLRNLFRNDFWGTPMIKEQSHKSYRPLTVLSFRVNYIFGELNPFGYHCINMILHSVVSFLYYWTLSSHFSSHLLSFLSSLLFVLHPIHVEAVTGVVGRAELLASIFYLLAFLLYTRHSINKSDNSTRLVGLIMSLISSLFGMLSKEQSITVLGLCFLYELIIYKRLQDGGKQIKAFHSLVRLILLICVTVLFMALRMQVMAGTLPVFTSFDNPAAASSSPTRQLTFNYLVSLNCWLLLHGCDLLCDWTMSTVPLVTSFLDPRNACTLLTYGVLATLVITGLKTQTRQSKKLSPCLLGLALLSLPFLPASNLFFHVGFVIAERILYLPSLGFCLLVSLGWTTIYYKLDREKKKGLKFLWIVSLFLLTLLHGIKTVTRNWDWKDEYSLFTSGLKISPQNAKLYNNVGHSLESKGSYEEALQYFLAAVHIQPDDIGAHINVGRIYNHMNLVEEAEKSYNKAKSLLPRSRPGEVYIARVAPNHLKVFLNLATLISKNRSRLEEADLLYRQAISMRSDYTEAYINRGDVLIKLNRTKEAQQVYEKALTIESDNPDIYYNLGVVFLEQGQTSQALAYLDKALEYDPNHHQALLNSAILIQESGATHLHQIALNRLLKIVQNGKSNERVFFNLGMLSMDSHDISEAENWFKMAIDIKPDFRPALFNIALLYSESNRPLLGEPFLHQLLHFYPNHIKGLILLGDLYVNSLGDLKKAESVYRTILQYDPNNVQGYHNLCVVMVEAGELEKAKDCLLQAQKLAPHEDYIIKHIGIVTQRLLQNKET